MPRKSDGGTTKTHFQMDRYVQQNGAWFYLTREGEERGPFESKGDASGDLIDYIRQIHTLQQYGL